MNRSFTCERCNKILNSISQYEAHLHSEGHMKHVNLGEASSKLVSETGIFKTDQYIQKYGTGYKCLACDIVLNSITTALSHADGQKHLKTIRNNMGFSDSGIASTSSLPLSDSDNLDIIDHEFSLHFIKIEDLLKQIKVIQVNDPIEF